MITNVSENNSLTKVLLIYTGGTIGMIEDAHTGLLRAFDFSILEQSIPELRQLGFKVETLQFDPPIDSSNVSPTLWYLLAQTVVEEYDHFDGFVILHGTDTMAYTASALSFMLEYLTKPVIFTGSQLPIGKLRTDGKENLITALQIAAAKRKDGQAMVPEVCIYFDYTLTRANRTIKCSADRFQAFASYNYPPLAHAGIDINFNQSTIHLPLNPELVPQKPLPLRDTKLTVLKIFPGITPDLVDAVVSLPNLHGIVLETYGSGNAPTFDWFLQAMKKAVDRGIVVVNVTQCLSGMVEMNRYDTGAALRSAGVISGYDMTTECVLTKLMYLFSKYDTPEEIREQMAISYCGEMTIT